MFRKMIRGLFRRNELTKEPEQVSWTQEEAEEAIAFRHLLVSLEKELHNSENQVEIVESALKAACDYYEADWAGILLADLGVNAWAPAAWYNRKTDGMTATAFKDVEFADGLDRWYEALMQDQPIILTDVETVRDSAPEEYELYQRLHTKSVIGVPYWKHPTGFLVVRNPQKHKTDSDLLRMLAFVSLSMFQVQELQGGIELMMQYEGRDKDNFVTVNILGTPEIKTSKGSISQDVYKSQKGWRIVVYLLLHQQTAIPAKQIAAAIWPREDNEVAADSIRGIIYRFKQKIDYLGIENLVISTPGGYMINPDFRIITDFDQMETIWKYASTLNDLEAKVESLKRALEIYRGNMFQDAADEEWILGSVSHYHLLYLQIAKALFEALDGLQDYCAIHDYTLRVLEIDHGNAEAQFWLICAMKKMGATDQAKRTLLAAKEVMIDEEYEEMKVRLDNISTVSSEPQENS